MAIKIVFANRKGGVGKTTSAVSFAGFLASQGYRVLACDFDGQANLTIALGLNPNHLSACIGDIFAGTADAQAVLSPTAVQGIDIIPTRKDLGEVVSASFISQHMRRNELFALRAGKVIDAYDFVVMDTASNTDGLPALNCLAVADYLITPFQPDHFSLEGLTALIQVVKKIKDDWLNPKLKLLGFLGTFHLNTKVGKENLQKARTEFGERIFSSVIRKNVELSACTEKGLPISHYNQNCHGYEDYAAFTEELLERINLDRGGL